ncbi:hypothetical protein ACFY3U_03475 [Micromonospora sp. NPDC000089]
MTTDETSSTTRRAIIRTGVAAGAGLGAAAVVASPASAAAGAPVIAGQTNDAGTAETVLVGGSSANPTLSLSGTSPMLRLVPDSLTETIPTELPTGSLAVTSSTDLVIGGKAGRRAYVNTSRWANRTVAIPPVRLLDTRAMSTYSANVLAGASGVVSGKLQAGKILQLTVSRVASVSAGQAVAAYVNITVANTVSAGVLTAYRAGITKPSTSSLNWWGPNQILSNLVEVPLGTYGSDPFSLAIHVNAATSVIVDVSGLILSRPGRGY